MDEDKVWVVLYKKHKRGEPRVAGVYRNKVDADRWEGHFRRAGMWAVVELSYIAPEWPTKRALPAPFGLGKV